jgi:hypothetical protein
VEPWNVRWTECNERRERRTRGDHAEETSRARDESGFGKQLPDQNATACAERCPNGHFAAARCAARERQTGDIAAGN